MSAKEHETTSTTGSSTASAAYYSELGSSAVYFPELGSSATYSSKSGLENITV
jgi:hypothetical protein